MTRTDTLHPTDTGPGWTDSDGDPAQLIVCPECGQMEWWTYDEANFDHGLCRSTAGPCPVCEG